MGVEGLQIGFPQPQDELRPLLLELLEHRPQQVAVGGEGVAAAVQSRLDAKLGHPQPTLGQEFSLHFGGVKITHLQDDGFLELAALIRKKIIERGGITVESLVDSGRKDNGGAERAASKAAQGRHRVGTLRRQLLAGAVGVAVELGHDVDVDAARHGQQPEQRLPAVLFRTVRRAEHLLVGRFQGRVRQHPEIAGDLAAVLERRGL